jgi:cytidylate kinase
MLSTEKNMVVVAIDGPAGAGKSTTAKALAARLNFSYIDTGAMYRALTLKALRDKINLEDEDALAQLAKKTSIDLQGNPQTGLKVLLDGQDVSVEIRTVEITNKTFYVARAPKVREVLVTWQRAIAKKKNIVMEGRDIGTVVFPHATYKFFLDADPEVRARRRIKELEEKGKPVDAKKITQELQERDQKDRSRSAGPLKKADDATYIDSTDLSIEQTVDKMLTFINTSR